MLRYLACCVSVGLISTLIGCMPSGPKMYEVKGKVTIKGQPAKGARLTFQPVDASIQAASGVVDESGNYKLYSGIEGKPGALPGQYKVVLLPDMSGGDPSQRYSGAKGPPKMDDKVIPKEWQDSTTSPKTVDVKAGINEINIEL